MAASPSSAPTRGWSLTATQEIAAGDGQCHGRAVEAVPLRRKLRRPAQHQPVACELRHDASADQGDERDDGRDGGPLGDFGLAEMEECVGRDQDREQGDDDQVAPVPPDRDLAGAEGGEDGKKGDVDRRRHSRTDPCRKRDGETPGEPERGERRQGKPPKRRAAGPAGDRGQQEPGDGRGDEAEQHLVDMPGDGVDRGRQFEDAGQHGQPQQQGCGRPEAGEEEERPEAPFEQRGHCRAVGFPAQCQAPPSGSSSSARIEAAAMAVQASRS